MGNKIVTEADRKRAVVKKAEGNFARQGTGQQVSRARGVATNNKKNPGKRPHKGG